MVNPWRLPTTRSFLELLIICGMLLNVYASCCMYTQCDRFFVEGTLVELNAPEFWTRYL